MRKIFLLGLKGYLLLYIASLCLVRVKTQNAQTSASSASSANPENPTTAVANPGPSATMSGATPNPTSTTTTGDEDDRSCGDSTGNILFTKPDSNSVVVAYSNFTIIWYYDSRTFNVIYPKNEIKLMLFNSEDAKYNDYQNSWKKPIFTTIIPLDQIEPGPQRKDGQPSYQWNWDTNFYANEGYTQPPTMNAQFKLRIIGDGKDITTNKENYPCYKDGDLVPGSTSNFYIVESKPLGTNFKPLQIPNSAISDIMGRKQLVISLLVSLVLAFITLG